MAVPAGVGADLWIYAVLFCALHVLPPVRSGDNNTAANELACPRDSAPDGVGGCVTPPPTPTPSAHPPESAGPSRNNCSGAAGDGAGGCPDCPDDSYLGGAGCRCLPLPCPVKSSCPPGTWAKIVRPATGRPGKCCALYECVTPESNMTCVDTASGDVRAEGSAWFGAECARCRCAAGLVLCDDADADAPAPHTDDDGLCPATPPGCRRHVVPPGRCCPVCIDGAVVVSEMSTTVEPATVGGCLGAVGERVVVGGVWRLDDCTSCVCEPGGHRRCQAYMCEACPEPRYEPGECCPRCNGSAVVTLPSHCPSLLNCSLRCVHGFVRDTNGCFTCHCQQDECLLDCPLGFEQDAQGNMLCRCASADPKLSVPSGCPSLVGCRKRCPHGFRTNRAGCPVCRCETCKPLDRCTKRCAHGLLSDHRGCALCKCTPLDHGLNVAADNETVGTPCISEDTKVWRDDGETWFDGCRQCYCLAGREMCSLLGCPPAPCPDPLYNSSKDCCPFCPGDPEAVAASGSHAVCQAGVDGGVLVEGETWSVGESGCVRCVCRGGRALCRAASCPPAPCSEPDPPPPGQCCPVCPPDQLDNHTLSVSCPGHRGQAMWREGDCVSCTCREDGRPACFTELCRQQAACSNPLRVKNQCCPICLDRVAATRSSGGVCTATNGSVVSVGSDWREDECTTCVCVSGGETACTKLVCSVACPNPVRKAGVCCHVCPEIRPLGSNRELGFTVLVSAVACAVALCVGFCAARWCRGIKRHRLKLHGNEGYHGCPPPQYTQYRYMPTYDSAQQPLGTSEKTALTPL